MTNKKQTYVFNLDAFYIAYKKKHNKEITIYQVAYALGVSYQTITNITEKPVKTLANLKILSALCGLDLSKLIKKHNG